ncbi:caspase a-like isoform X1 [Cololabis saira]|uniref:caspase a-like isoform X1 n=1 Tax=Cololabis saira TaxID=129043 RepID=UPI002AD262C0|nr:caspase a-like isoform X1 [Cololabis saira]
MADGKLQSVRLLFVEKVSKEMINQLLDSLLEDSVLNDGEKDSIIEENNTKNNKARALIDAVRRKGDESSRKMIAHIQMKDPTLYSELGLSDVEPAQTDGFFSRIRGFPTKSFSIEEFWRSKQNDPDVYPVTETSHRNRVALLITNIRFSNARMNRKGAEVDHKNMERQLSSLGYEVVTYTDLTGEGMNKAFIKFAKHPKLSETDSVVVVVMSHGKLGVVLGVNHSDNGFPINNIYTHLGSKNCPALLNKPKIIIIQACRGGERGSVFVSDDVSQPVGEQGWDEDSIRSVHKEKDFISLLSCTPDTVSYRNKYQGSLLIQFFVDQCDSSANQDHIQELFRKVMQRFEDFQIGDDRQMATIDRSTLLKHFYFFPGL